MGLNYAKSGVDRDSREEAKKGFSGFESTFSMSRHGEMIRTPFNTLYPVHGGLYHVKTCDGIGTKVLLSEAAGKHDTIGIDAIAMVVNDCIRTGARPIALTNVIDIQKSEPGILGEIQKGLQKGAELSSCPLVGGETADVPELLSTRYHINCDCVGEVRKERIITGQDVKPGNAVIGLRSSGAHSNGVSLLRKALFSKWGGRHELTDIPDGFDRELIHHALEPTEIYVRDFLRASKDFAIHGAIHITGDAYLKFKRLTSHGFIFDNFRPHPIFGLIQECGKVNEAEMYKTFNMGWGFALIVNREDSDDVLQKIRNSEKIGTVTDSGGVAIKQGDRKILL